MTRIYNQTPQKALRKRLRKDAPLAERLLWAKLRRTQVDELKFRRQYGIGEYVVDFYCPAAKLAVEVDGETHFNEVAERRDARRQAYIESFGIRFMRFTNLEVERNLPTVIDEIWRVATDRIRQVRGTAAVPSPLLTKEGARGRLRRSTSNARLRQGTTPTERESATNDNSARTEGNPPVSPLGKGGGAPEPYLSKGGGI